MILYSVTVNIDPAIHDEWLSWMREVHVPEVLATGCFSSNKILKLLDPPQDGITYSFQYTAPSMEKLKEYQIHFAPALQAAHQQKYTDKFAAFRTILEIVA